MVKIHATNFIANLDLTEDNVIYHEMINFLKKCPLSYALTHEPKMHVEVLTEFWDSALVSEDRRQIMASIGDFSLVINSKLVNKALHLPLYDRYDDLPSTADIESMLQRIGYRGNTRKLGYISRSHMTPSWSFLFNVIIRSLTVKSGGWDQAPQLVLNIAYGLIRNRKINYGSLIFHELCSRPRTGNLVYPRFITMVIKHVMGKKYPVKGTLLETQKIHQRIFAQLAKKNHGEEEEPITSCMLSVLNAPSPTVISSKDTLRREEPSSSTPVSQPFKRVKSIAPKPPSAGKQPAFVYKRGTSSLSSSSQKEKDIKKSSIAQEHTAHLSKPLPSVGERISAAFAGQTAPNVATADTNDEKEDTEKWMEDKLSISLDEAKKLVRQEYLTTLASDSSFAGLPEIAEEINAKYKASLKFNYLLVSGVADEVTGLKHYHETLRNDVREQIFKAQSREQGMKEKLITLEDRMSEMISLIKSQQALIQTLYIRTVKD